MMLELFVAEKMMEFERENVENPHLRHKVYLRKKHDFIRQVIQLLSGVVK
jgi:hypothetical protein